MRDELKETTGFVDFINLRIDSFENVLKQHTTEQTSHAEQLTILAGHSKNSDFRLKQIEKDEVFQLQSGRLREMRDKMSTFQSIHDTGISEVKTEFS